MNLCESHKAPLASLQELFNPANEEIRKQASFRHAADLVMGAARQLIAILEPPATTVLSAMLSVKYNS